jgi:hypothetical protein
MHRLERRPLAMRRVATPTRLLATRTRALPTAPFDACFLSDLFDDPTHDFD